MTEIIGVRFRNRGKIYYFDPNGQKFKEEEGVIVETSAGMEYGVVNTMNKYISDDKVVNLLKKIIRRATDSDVQAVAANRKKESEAFDIFVSKVEKHKLDMNLVNVEYAFDGSKILFYFTSDGRVDFRELVKDLASIFRRRIELRQIGVRDETKMIGGIGICGRPFCCSQFLNDFQPVSIKMAKDQGLSLNPTKISGACGRLMCCLNYEQEGYVYLKKTMPRVGTPVKTAEGKGFIHDIDLLTGNIKVRLDENPDAVPLSTNVKDVEIMKRPAPEKNSKDKKTQMDK